MKTAEHWRDLDMSVARLRIMSAGFERDASARRRTLPTAWTTSAWRPLASARARSLRPTASAVPRERHPDRTLARAVLGHRG